MGEGVETESVTIEMVPEAPVRVQPSSAASSMSTHQGPSVSPSIRSRPTLPLFRHRIPPPRESHSLTTRAIPAIAQQPQFNRAGRTTSLRAVIQKRDQGCDFMAQTAPYYCFYCEADIPDSEAALLSHGPHFGPNNGLVTSDIQDGWCRLRLQDVSHAADASSSQAPGRS